MEQARSCRMLPRVLLGLLCAVSAEQYDALYKDPSEPVEARVQDILKRLTLDEKLGQMTQIEMTVANASVIEQYDIGSVSSSGGSTPAPKATAEQWINMTDHFKSGTTILEAIKKKVNSKTKLVYKASPIKGAAENKGDEYAIIVVGERPYAEFNGDNNNLTLPDPYPELIIDTCSQVRCVVVMVSGRPLVVENLVGHMDAFVAAWLPGTEGKGIAEVLFGEHEFQGNLSRTWCKSVEQLPMNVGDKRYDPLYPFVFGLKTKPL